jgi:hypothetical protein
LTAGIPQQAASGKAPVPHTKRRPAWGLCVQRTNTGNPLPPVVMIHLEGLFLLFFLFFYGSFLRTD